MTTKNDIHQKAVEFAACYLIESGVPTRAGPGRGIDLILDNGETILVRGMSKEITLALTSGSLDSLKADYVIVVTDLKYRTRRKIYIMDVETAKQLSDNCALSPDNPGNWFVGVAEYREYRENHEILI